VAIFLPIVSEFKPAGVTAAARSVEGLQKKTGGLSAKMKKAGKVAGLAFAGIAGAGALAAKALIGAGERASTSNARISQVAESMGIFGDQTGAVSDRLVKLAESTALQTGVDQNAIKMTQAKLLTFKDLALTADEVGGSFDRATNAAIDMAAAGFGTAEGNAVQLGKALNDPVKGIAALAKSGVTFTDAEKKMIESMVKSGDMLGAQSMVLAAIETQVGGTAAATANASDKMKVAFSQLSEKAGTALLPIFEKVVAFLIGKVFPVIAKLGEIFGKRGLSGVFDYVAKAARDAFPKIVTVVQGALVKLRDVLVRAGAAFVEWIGPRIGPMLAKLGELIAKAANWLLDVGLPMLVEKLTELGSALVAWIGPQIPVALQALGKLYVALQKWLYTKALPKLVVLAAKLGVALISWAWDLAPKILEGLGKLVLELVSKVPGLFSSLVSAMADMGRKLGSGLIDALVSALKGLGNFATDIGRSIVNAIIGFVNREVIDRINGLLEFEILGKTVDIGDIQRIPLIPLASGGIVRSPTTALIGEAGPEAVIPLSRLGSLSGGDVYVTVSGALDPVSVARQIRQILNDDARRRTGRIALA
jgi:hypothetical protein